MSSFNILLLGLQRELAAELLPPLQSCGVTAKVVDGMRDVLGSFGIIFCGADVNLVAELRLAMPQAAIVVVSRHPDVSVWLDSIEAGASDYCAAPFETAQVRWILEASKRTNRAAVAA